MRILAVCFLFAGGFLFETGAVAQTVACDAVRAMTQEAAVASAHWGVAVTAMDGTPICSINEAQLFRPASNNKIFTTAAALALLGAERRFTTRVVAAGEVRDGVLHGDLQLVGGGDANFGSHDVPYVPPAKRLKDAPPEGTAIADIEELAEKVAAAGVKSVEGDVVGVDRYFAWEPYPPAWAADDLIYGYGAPVAALTIHDNEIVYRVAGPVVTVMPDSPYYMLQRPAGSATFAGDCDTLEFERSAGRKLLELFGAMKPGSAACVQAIAIEDPAEYAAMALKAALERRGVRFAGGAKASHSHVRNPMGVLQEDKEKDARLATAMDAVNPQLPLVADAVAGLAMHLSPTLLEDITYTNKVSQNLHAELMLRNLAVLYGHEGSQREGLRVVRQYLLHAGVAAGDFVLYDGSGLSTHDLVAPRALAKFLSFAATQPWFAQWKATLPEGGVDGSLGGRFTAGMKGRLFAKTGTLGESRALSGYLTGASGKTVIFSVMVDTHMPGTGADRAAMDRIVEAIAAGN